MKKTFTKLLALTLLLSSGLTERTQAQEVSRITYQAHVQNIGWQPWVNENETAGTVGKSLRMEAIKIKLVNPPGDMGVCYSAHIQNQGSNNWTTSCNGAEAGTVHQNLRMEAIKIWLTRPPSGQQVCYRAHFQNIGWQNWVCDGKIAGTTGASLRLEAIEIKIVP